MANITSFLTASTTAADNTQVNGIGIDGTKPVSNFDNAMRENWAILRRDLDGRMVLTSKSANYTAVANDNNAVIRFSAAATLSLTAAATLGAGWHCWVVADVAAVVIDPNGAETINGAATITIPYGSSTLVICDGTNFRALSDYLYLNPSIDVASAATTDIGAAASQYVRVTGTTTITSLGSATNGIYRRVRFAGALTLAHNATSLILPGSANITTANGDIAEFISEGSGNWRCVRYQYAAFRGNGGVVETGSNANGSYTKFADGTMICWSPDIAFANVSSALGSIFASSGVATWTFPATFDLSAVTPSVQANDTGSANIWTASRVTGATAVEIRLYSGISVATARTVRAVATGKWF